TNRVPTPASPDYAVMWPISMPRLEFNITTYSDNAITGSITSNVLTVTAVANGIVAPGQTLYGAALTGTPVILAQTSGTTGGIGTYTVTATADAISGLLYCGTRAMMQPQDVGIQIDVHGPTSAANTTRITTQWFDQTGVDACAAQGGIIAPLYADSRGQIEFIDDQNQYEERWVIDLHMQANPVVTITQQFADQLAATATAVEALT
ncbi:MAG TPA: hypothetical protein VNF49_01730, partial [Candidatus Binataceae bacterium]|nr:hypothetical protein [Candidatus Binataceae bacterium]